MSNNFRSDQVKDWLRNRYCSQIKKCIEGGNQDAWKSSTEVGLQIDEQKTMNWSDKQFQEGRKCKIGRKEENTYELKDLDIFIYLGARKVKNSQAIEPVKARLMAQNECLMPI